MKRCLHIFLLFLAMMLPLKIANSGTGDWAWPVQGGYSGNEGYSGGSFSSNLCSSWNNPSPSCTSFTAYNWVTGNATVCNSFVNDPINPAVTFGYSACTQNHYLTFIITPLLIPLPFPFSVGIEDGPHLTTVTLGQEFSFNAASSNAENSGEFLGGFTLVEPSTWLLPTFAGAGNPPQTAIPLINAPSSPITNVYQSACNNIQYYSSSQDTVFLQRLCGNNPSLPPLPSLPAYNPPTSTNPCKDINDPRIVCNLLIACAYFGNGNNGGIYGQCFFLDLPPSPPPFCCTIEAPSQIPETAEICADGTTPSAINDSCIPFAPVASGAPTMYNNFFTPAIRIAFDAPTGDFLPVQLPISSGQYTIPVCNGQNQPSCVTPTVSPLIKSPLPLNLEVIYESNNYVNRYMYQQDGTIGSLYGVNLGQYCDVNFDRRTNTSGTCVIEDMNGNSYNLQAAVACTDPYHCKINAQNIPTPPSPSAPKPPPVPVGSPYNIPPMPLPEVVPCSGINNTPDKFCMTLNFPNNMYTAIIAGQSGVAPSIPGAIIPYSCSGVSPSMAPSSCGSIAGLSLEAVVTDDNYNVPASGSICLDSNGNSVAPCPTGGAGGLYYVNGQYISGGTQFCYTPQGLSSCNANCNSVLGCNCVNVNTITVTAKNPNPPPATLTATMTTTDNNNRITPGPDAALPLTSYYVGPNPPVKGALRGMNPLELGLCIPIAQADAQFNCKVANNSDSYGAALQGYCSSSTISDSQLVGCNDWCAKCGLAKDSNGNSITPVCMGDYGITLDGCGYLEGQIPGLNPTTSLTCTYLESADGQTQYNAATCTCVVPIPTVTDCPAGTACDAPCTGADCTALTTLCSSCTDEQSYLSGGTNCPCIAAYKQCAAIATGASPCSCVTVQSGTGPTATTIHPCQLFESTASYFAANPSCSPSTCTPPPPPPP